MKKEQRKKLQVNRVGVKFSFSKTGHLLVKGKINGKSGVFIIDTGAAISCVGMYYAPYFQLRMRKSRFEIRAITDVPMPTEISKKNIFELGKWRIDQASFLTIDLDTVNQTFSTVNQEAVQGIIGNDILKKYKAVIDYENKSIFLIIKS
ncbi:aspartyl protease family protein [Flavobacterium sp.]|uniref:aspartyl protease family protein n=1 Tax=Flavobacterium sp. TaxID=239 RepID=UPI002603DFDE|nr:aspartyl protease family protein [Flavobacterium sp.]